MKMTIRLRNLRYDSVSQLVSQSVSEAVREWAICLDNYSYVCMDGWMVSSLRRVTMYARG